ncbi:hypothetical protein LPJ64_000388 [Coemansia asiatica]|uniref:Uncharacterized protein n=1 Tax=Coemansia asiatica TaxID=1052880 RepID=A0A9W8CLL3_9FUNG|nr:hypothetical protein LPJ64_000388 [Coemansia asiatica]
MDSNMDLDPVEPNTSQRAQNLASTNTAPFTPPYVADSTPEAQGSSRDMRQATSLRAQRASDSAAPESPSEAGRRTVFVQQDSTDMDEDVYENVPEADYVSQELQGMPVDESETIIHRDFFDNFGNEWTILN